MPEISGINTLTVYQNMKFKPLTKEMASAPGTNFTTVKNGKPIATLSVEDQAKELLYGKPKKKHTLRKLILWAAGIIGGLYVAARFGVPKIAKEGQSLAKLKEFSEKYVTKVDDIAVSLKTKVVELKNKLFSKKAVKKATKKAK